MVGTTHDNKPENKHSLCYTDKNTTTHRKIGNYRVTEELGSICKVNHM